MSETRSTPLTLTNRIEALEAELCKHKINDEPFGENFGLTNRIEALEEELCNSAKHEINDEPFGENFGRGEQVAFALSDTPYCYVIFLPMLWGQFPRSKDWGLVLRICLFFIYSLFVIALQLMVCLFLYRIMLENPSPNCNIAFEGLVDDRKEYYTKNLNKYYNKCESFNNLSFCNASAWCDDDICEIPKEFMCPEEGGHVLTKATLPCRMYNMRDVVGVKVGVFPDLAGSDGTVPFMIGSDRCCKPLTSLSFSAWNPSRFIYYWIRVMCVFIFSVYVFRDIEETLFLYLYVGLIPGCKNKKWTRYTQFRIPGKDLYKKRETEEEKREKRAYGRERIFSFTHASRLPKCLRDPWNDCTSTAKDHLKCHAIQDGGMAFFYKVILCFFWFTPKLFIALFLWYFGCGFIIHTKGMSRLSLNFLLHLSFFG